MTTPFSLARATAVAVLISTGACHAQSIRAEPSTIVRRGLAGKCQQVRYPSSRDNTHRVADSNVMKTLSAHLKATNSYNVTTIVKLTGLDARSEELQIPSSAAAERATMAYGQRAGATFIEVWPIDAGRLGSEIDESARALK